MATVKIVTVDETIEVKNLIFITIFNDGINAGYEPGTALADRFIPKEKLVAMNSRGTLLVQWKTNFNHDGTRSRTCVTCANVEACATKDGVCWRPKGDEK